MRTVPASEMRVSDDERERVASFLREQSLAGRLDHEELEERLGRAYRAVTVGDLERLIADLPHRRVPRQPVRHHSGPPPALIGVGVAGLAAVMVPGLIALAVALVAVAGAVAIAALFALGFVFGPFILLALLIGLAARRRRPRQFHPHWR